MCFSIWSGTSGATGTEDWRAHRVRWRVGPPPIVDRLSGGGWWGDLGYLGRKKGQGSHLGKKKGEKTRIGGLGVTLYLITKKEKSSKNDIVLC